MNRGYVYVLSNPSMPGIVKIGRSKYGGQGRADTFYKNDTGVPTPFELEFEALFSDAHQIERELHKWYADQRVNKAREFFAVDPFKAAGKVAALCAREMGLECGEWAECFHVMGTRDGWIDTDDGQSYCVADVTAALERLLHNPTALARLMTASAAISKHRRERMGYGLDPESEFEASIVEGVLH